MTKFTSGPWNIQNDYEIVNRKNFIADCDVDCGEDCLLEEDVIANVHLISAAPDLYEALAALIEYIPTEAVECRGDKCRKPWCISCFGEDEAQEAMVIAENNFAKAITALSKARGEMKVRQHSERSEK